MWKILICSFILWVSLVESFVLPEKEKPVKAKSLASCRININRDLIDPQPLLIYPETTEFVYPTHAGGIIEIDLGGTLELFCNGGFIFESSMSTAFATCVEGNLFKVNGNTFRFNELFCNRHSLSVARRTEEGCYKDGSLIMIGFDIENRFIPLYEVCFDENIEQTYYSHYKISRFATSAQTANAIGRPSFRQGEFFPGRNVEGLLNVDNQVVIFTEILGCEELAGDIIRRSGQLFLARGHLAANGDFILRAHQRATFWFVNSAPQWQRFNNGNWVAIETASRALASSRGTTLNVYTGTFGVMSLEDCHHDVKNVFLDVEDSRIPAVNFFYKILIDESTSSGIVFIGINNVHITIEEIKKAYIICNDVSDLVTYVRSWHRNDIRRGFSYACDVNQFLKVVPHIRGIRVSNLLL